MCKLPPHPSYHFAPPFKLRRRFCGAEMRIIGAFVQSAMPFAEQIDNPTAETTERPLGMDGVFNKPRRLYFERRKTKLRLATTPGAVPVWARQMEIWFLENAGEDATAASMLHRQLLDGEINDELDYKFTYDRLKEMREKMVERGEMTDGENRRLINQLDAPQVNTKE